MAKETQAAIIAAEWWTKAIANPTANSFCNGDRTSNESFMIMMLGHMKAMQNAATEEQLEKFCNLLTKRIEKELTKNNKVDLDCDYAPDNILEETAEEVGINVCLFPYKRHMIVTNNSVSVKDGYDVGWVQIYSEEAE